MSSCEYNLKNEEDPKNVNTWREEDYIKNEDDPKNEDYFKNEDNFKNEDDPNMKTIPKLKMSPNMNTT